jgi:hypothetical protein
LKINGKLVLGGVSSAVHLYFCYALVQSIHYPNLQSGERVNNENQIKPHQASGMPQTPRKSQNQIADPTKSESVSRKEVIEIASLAQRVPRSVALDIYFQRKKIRGAVSADCFDKDEIALMESLYPELAPGTISECIDRLGKAARLIRSNQANYVVSTLGDAAIFAPSSEQVSQLETLCETILAGLPVSLAHFLKSNVIKPLLPSQGFVLTYRIDHSQAERRLIVKWGQDEFNVDANKFIKDNGNLHSVAGLYR